MVRIEEIMFHSLYYDDTIEADVYRQSGVDYVMMSTAFLGTRIKKAYTIDEIDYVVNELQLDVIVVLNRFYFEADLGELENILIELDKRGVRRLLFSDFAVLNLVQRNKLSFYCICQTDTTMTSSRDIQQMFTYGAHECVIARELTLDESCYILDHTEGNIGIHFFGYPLMSSSRKHHLQNYFNFVKKPIDFSEAVWLKEQNRKEYYLSVEDQHGNSMYYGHVVSPYRDIERLNRANVTLYYDTIGLDTMDVLCFLSMIVHHESTSVIEETMAKRYITIERGLLDQASVLRKDTK